MTPPAPDPDRPCADWSRPSPGSASVAHRAGLTVPSASRLQITLGDTAVGMPVVTSYLGGSSRTTRLMLAGLTAVPCADDDGTADGTGACEWVHAVGNSVSITPIQNGRMPVHSTRHELSRAPRRLG